MLKGVSPGRFILLMVFLVKDSIEHGTCFGSDFIHVLQRDRCPAGQQRTQRFHLSFGRGQPILRMPRQNANAVIQRAVERSGLVEELRRGMIQQIHVFDDLNARRCIQHLIEHAGAFQPQVHQDEVDVVEAAPSGFERMLHAVLAFDLHAHLF